VPAEAAERVLSMVRPQRPLGLYERVEALGAIFAAGRGQLADPVGLVRAGTEMRRWRGNPAGIVAAAAAQHPNRVAIVDDDGALTSAELERRTNALARLLLERGVGPGSTLGVLAGNGAIVIEAGMAAYKSGANCVYLNTGFSSPQLAEVAEREGIDLVVADDEQAARHREGGSVAIVSRADTLAAYRDGEDSSPPPPERLGGVVVLTSGTTGTPRGAQRSKTGSALDAAGILACIPFEGGDTTIVAAPLFHGLGLFNANLALALGSTVVLRSRFGAEEVLADVGQHRARVLVAVPAMLQRIMALPRRTLDRYDCSSLRIVVSGGSALSADLANRCMDRFGEIVYNVYGSTEAALATIATPRDLRVAPGTAGRATPGVRVRVLRDDDSRARPGETGRIFVGSGFGFDGYTGGGGKDSVDGMLSTGDVGHVDRWGRLFIEGRADDMIVSGGENVYPAEVEDCLAEHPAVLEAAVLGVPDDEFGQRLAVFVVLRPGRTVGAEELKDHVRGRLARFKVPREIAFLDSLPRNATGKVVKRNLQPEPAGESRSPEERNPS